MTFPSHHDVPARLRDVLGGGSRLVAMLARRHPWAFLVAVGGAVGFVTGVVATALVVGRLTDAVVVPALSGEPVLPSRVWLAAGILSGVATWRAVGITVRKAAAGWVQYRTRADIRRDLVDRQLRLSLAWYGDRAVGELLSVSEVDTLQATFVLGPLPFAIGSALLLVGSSALVLALDPVLGLIVVGGLVTMVSLDVHGALRTFPPFVALQDRRGTVAQIAHEAFDGALTVKALGREDEETGRFRAAAETVRDGVVDVDARWVTYRSVVEAIPALLVVGLLVVGVHRVAAGSLVTGDLVTITYLVSLLALPVQLVGYVVWEMAHGQAAWRRVRAVLEAGDLVPYGEERARPESTAARVGAEGIGFGYGERPILHDVRLAVAPGTVLAVVGATGAGKSTLVRLLARLWDPATGRIEVDGRDLTSFAPAELPREVAFVDQEPFLFDDTVEDNVTLGLDLPFEDVEAAARLSQAHDFIEGLPNGYRTRVGERGVALSGGQRQRVALARALVRRPRLLVLDDATSAVDPTMEARILDRLRSAELPATIVLVAYRPAIIALADEVVYLEGGRIVAQGTHETLLCDVPGYAGLVRAYAEDAARGREGR